MKDIPMDLKVLDIISKNYKLTERKVGEEGCFKVAGMTFKTRLFEANGLGSVSIMKAKGFCGLMQMITVIVNPFYVDAPLFSYDSISAFGNNTTYIEIFDTTLSGKFDMTGLEEIRCQYSEIPNKDVGSHWYDDMRIGTPICKTAGKNRVVAVNELACRYFSAYINNTLNCAACDEKAKRFKASVYSDGLLANGGPATDPVKKAIGEERTAYFFKNILFATVSDHNS